MKHLCGADLPHPCRHPTGLRCQPPKLGAGSAVTSQHVLPAAAPITHTKQPIEAHHECASVLQPFLQLHVDFLGPTPFCFLGERRAALNLGSCHNSMGTLGVLPQNAALTLHQCSKAGWEVQHNKGCIVPRCTVSLAESWQLMTCGTGTVISVPSCRIHHWHTSSPSVLGPGSILWCLSCCLLQSPICKREGNPARMPCNMLEGTSCSLSNSSEESKVGFLHQQRWHCHGDERGWGWRWVLSRCPHAAAGPALCEHGYGEMSAWLCPQPLHFAQHPVLLSTSQKKKKNPKTAGILHRDSVGLKPASPWMMSGALFRLQGVFQHHSPCALGVTGSVPHQASIFVQSIFRMFCIWETHEECLLGSAHSV